MDMAHYRRHIPTSQKMAVKTAFAICQTKMARHNLGVKSQKCHKYQASGTVSPGFSAVLQITDSSMTCCKHLLWPPKTYLSTAATPKVAVFVGLQKIVPCSPLHLLQRMCSPDKKQGGLVSFAVTLTFYTNLCKAMRARTASWDGQQRLKKSSPRTYSTVRPNLLGL